MNLRDISQVLSLLRDRLSPASEAASTIDALESTYPQARKAAVLLALFEQENETYIIFIHRASTLRMHAGEIAFPGGSYETGDASLVATALRETSEEIGLPPSRVEVLGLLAPIFTVASNFVVTPVVAYLPAGPGQLLPQASEVAQVLLLPLHALADPGIAHKELWTSGGRTHEVYFYDYDSHRIWGATGRMLNTLLTLLQQEIV